MSAPEPGHPRLADFPAHRVITTRWADEDIYGHVNNVAYYSYFDTAVNGFLIESTGTDVRKSDAIGLVVETQCHFLRELRFPLDVTVGLAVTRIGNSSVVYEIGIFQEPEEAPAALGRFVHVYVDGRTRKVVGIPELIREAVLPLYRRPLGTRNAEPG